MKQQKTGGIKMMNNENVMIEKCTEDVVKYVQESVVKANKKIQDSEKIEKVSNYSDLLIETMEYYLVREVPSLVNTIKNF